MQKLSDSLEALLLVVGLTFFVVLIYRSAGHVSAKHQPYQVASPAVTFGASPYLQFQNTPQPQDKAVAVPTTSGSTPATTPPVQSHAPTTPTRKQDTIQHSVTSTDSPQRHELEGVDPLVTNTLSSLHL